MFIRVTATSNKSVDWREMLLNVNDVISVADMEAGEDTILGERSYIELRGKPSVDGRLIEPVYLLSKQTVDEIEQKIDRALEKSRSVGHARR